jgi:tRNA uridine 5-carboxymethylaminomethyl modification enzyme
VRELERLKTTWVNPRMLDKTEAERVLGKEIEREYCLYDLLRRPEVSYSALMTLPGVQTADKPEFTEEVEIQAKYQGYIERQAGEIARQEGQETTKLPDTWTIDRTDHLRFGKS